MKKWLILFAALALLTGASAVCVAGIVGSLHDFTNTGWSGGQICLPCHTPHNGELVENAPLWNHALSQASYNMYSSPSMDALVPGDPDGASKLCLSCHDGTVALDAFGGSDGTGILISGDYNLGTDLSNDHPISIIYDDALANDDGGLFLPSVKNVTIGSGTQTRSGSIEEVLLADNQLQCSACHSVHNDFVAGDEYLLKISIEGSELCLACHDK